MLIPWEQFPLKVNPYSEGKQNNFDRVGSPANVSIPPKINKITQKLIQSDLQQAPNTKGKKDKYNKPDAKLVTLSQKGGNFFTLT